MSVVHMPSPPNHQNSFPGVIGMRRHVLFLVVGLAACSSTEPNADSVLATTESQTYARPRPVVARIDNQSSETLHTNGCLLFQRETGADWVDLTSQAVCTAVDREIRARSTSSAAGLMPAEAPAGIYRGMIGFSTSQGAAVPVIYTNTFVVQ